MSGSAPAPQWADSSRGLGRWIERLIGIRLLRRPLFSGTTADHPDG